MFKLRKLIAAVLIGATPMLTLAQDFDDVVTKVEARVEPATAKRGEAVKWTLTVEVAPGWHTYPTRQADPMAAPYVNRIRFPKDGELIFVGEVTEPKTIVKDEDGARVAMVEGKGVWTRTLLVSPEAKPGKIKAPVRVTILACADRCLPPKTIDTEVELTISDAPAVPVDPKYRKELSAPNKK